MFKKFAIMSGFLLLIVLVGCGKSDGKNDGKKTNQIANPASTNCFQKDGNLVMEKKPDGSEYGVCKFKNGKECEEWALFNDSCPVGGVDTANYDKAGRYCLITGNKYLADVEPPQCSLTSGKVCDAEKYYQNNCLGESNSEFWKDIPAQVDSSEKK
ncbi:MAG: DUF333 domain-containing protein [Patescibacteria group bacterium]